VEITPHLLLPAELQTLLFVVNKVKINRWGALLMRLVKSCVTLKSALLPPLSWPLYLSPRTSHHYLVLSYLCGHVAAILMALMAVHGNCLLGSSIEICATSGTSTTSSVAPICTAQSEPNPIASMYPQSVTGTINETIVVLPISYKLARSLVPSEYKILSGYKSLIPELDDDLYPVRRISLRYSKRNQGTQTLIYSYSS
jgi:hypothetical protein